jgi:hypothetical protein
VAGATRRLFDSSAGTELCDPEEVVGGADQISRESGPLHAPIARATEVADRLDPAEDFLDPLAHSLAHRVSRPTGGAQVERRATRTPLILRHVWSDIERAAARHKRRRVVALVASHRNSARPANLLEHLQPLLAFGPTAGLTHAEIEHDAVAILHQHALGVAEPGLFAGALLRQPGFGIGRRLVGRVLAPFAVEVHARIAGIIRRHAIAALLTLKAKALERGPRLACGPGPYMHVAGQPKLARLRHHGAEKLTRHVVLQQARPIAAKARVVEAWLVPVQVEEPAEQKIVVQLLTEHPLTRTSEVVSGFYSFLGFPRLTTSQAIRRLIAEGVHKGVFGYTIGNPAVGSDGKFQVDRSKVAFECPLDDGEVDLESGFLIVPSGTCGGSATDFRRPDSAGR